MCQQGSNLYYLGPKKKLDKKTFLILKSRVSPNTFCVCISLESLKALPLKRVEYFFIHVAYPIHVVHAIQRLVAGQVQRSSKIAY